MISEILIRVWHQIGGTAAVPCADNFCDDIYNILVQQDLTNLDMIPVLKHLVDLEGVHSGTAFALLKRGVHDRSLRNVVRRQLMRERRGHLRNFDSVTGQIYALVILHNMGDSKAVQELRDLPENRRSTPFEREVIEELLQKLRASEDVGWEDVADLYIP